MKAGGNRKEWPFFLNGQGGNLGSGTTPLLFSKDPTGSFSCQNHRQFHTTLHVYIATEPPASPQGNKESSFLFALCPYLLVSPSAYVEPDLVGQLGFRKPLKQVSIPGTCIP